MTKIIAYSISLSPYSSYEQSFVVNQSNCFKASLKTVMSQPLYSGEKAKFLHRHPKCPTGSIPYLLLWLHLLEFSHLSVSCYPHQLPCFFSRALCYCNAGLLHWPFPLSEMLYLHIDKTVFFLFDNSLLKCHLCKEGTLTIFSFSLFYLNYYIDVWSSHQKVYIFNIYSLMSLEICIQLWILHAINTIYAINISITSRSFFLPSYLFLLVFFFLLLEHLI